MITIAGRKMGKSYNNVIKLTELFSGNHPLLEKAYSPMTIRFFILQTHYRSTLDFSNEALQAAEKGLRRLMDAYAWLQGSAAASLFSNGTNGDEKPNSGDPHEVDLDAKVAKLLAEFDEFINDDFSTAKVLANMFELVPIVNSLKDGNLRPGDLSATTFNNLKGVMKTYVEDILGLQDETGPEVEKLKGVMDVLISLRQQARARKDWVTSDSIRNQLAEVGIVLKDEKNGSMTWSV
jgi:cysteinyl-tRNA synthetase